jgi:hypothetical protein
MAKVRETDLEILQADVTVSSVKYIYIHIRIDPVDPS